MCFAAASGASRVVTNAAVKENEAVFLSNLEQLSEEAERRNVDSLLENPGDGKPNVINDGETVAALLTALKLPRVQVNYDFGNVISHFFKKVRPEQDWSSARRVANYFLLRDIAFDGEDRCFPELGTGVIDYVSVLATIRHDA